MNNFIISIFASLVATAIAALIAFCFKDKLSSLIKRWLINIFDASTYNIFPSESDKDYNADLNIEMFRAKYINIFAGRGNFLFEEPFRTVFEKQDIEINILLPDIGGKYDIDWIETAIGNINSSESFRNQITASESHLSAMSKDKPKVQVRKYHALAIGRIIITDKTAYFQPYTKDFSDRSPIYKYRVGSLMYMWLVRYFDSYWKPNQSE